MPVYQGHCHCGDVAFEVNIDDAVIEGVRCDCSLCRRKGAIMILVDQAQFTLLTGQDELTEYQWNSNIARHFFCQRCGIYTHHQPRSAPEKIGINVGCIDEIDPASLTITVRTGSALSLV